jgi:hypothetical protein
MERKSVGYNCWLVSLLPGYLPRITAWSGEVAGVQVGQGRSKGALSLIQTKQKCFLNGAYALSLIDLWRWDVLRSLGL